MLVPREASRSTKELSNLTLKWQIKDLEIDPNVHDKSISHCLPLKKKKKIGIQSENKAFCKD